MTLAQDRNPEVIDGALLVCILYRWRWLVMAAVLFCTGGGYLWASSQPERVELESVVAFAMIDAGQPLLPDLAAYKAKDAILPNLLQAADKNLSPRIWTISADNLLPIVTVTAKANAKNRSSVEKVQEMLIDRIVASQSDLLGTRKAELDADVLRADGKIKILQTELGEIEQKLAELRGAAAVGGEPQLRMIRAFERNTLDAQRFNVRESLWNARSESIAAARQAAKLMPPEIIQPMAVHVRPALLSGGLALFVFGVLGLVLGTIAAFVGEFLRCAIAGFKRVGPEPA